MAQQIFCPRCNETHDATKKGVDKKNRKRWQCKHCNRSFTEGVIYPDAEKVNSKVSKEKRDVKETKPSKVNVAQVPVKKTIITLNSTHLVELPQDMTREEAFNAIKNSHRGVSLDNCNVSTAKSVKTINFRSTGGTKG